MKLENSTIYQLDERSRFMMSFVVTTGSGKLIVVDGGRPEDVPHLEEYVGERKVDAWILTHPHDDHITAFIDIVKRRGVEGIGRVYYDFPPVEFIDKYESREAHTLREFLEIEPVVRPIAHIPEEGERVDLDDVTIEFIQTNYKGEKYCSNAVNDSSLVFRIVSPRTTVLFLGDLGPEGGDRLLAEKREKLKADIVQMAHHGHMCVEKPVYEAIAPRACMWCAPDWLYNEPPRLIRNRMYGEMLTRQWMDELGVRTHYVTMNGTNVIAY